ncbi:DUF4153 domain-containing protein [Caulobacter hibisci]|uniref:DUF4153 domain-containing protein n=1 Tax=Caulobacter hibisci TaxID=2035993 RepID=A0ABS0T303_9CAUL|nr:DUF4153 domain-containing protein [Caulobacter hibisci]MBI1686267.1 DUF4153 domain-containing protein [Caulobacter hibisci]
MTDQTVEADPRAVRRTTVLRLVTGLAQGLLLYWLYQANEHKFWPHTQPQADAALGLAFLFAPFVVLAGVSTLRWRTLAAWKGAAVLLAAGVGAYGVWSGDPAARGVDGLGPLNFIGLAALLFIGHHLVEPADIERRPIARFASYFDITWKHGVQLVLAAGFTGAFWLLLFLAAALFKLIGVDAIDALIKTELFAFPATTTMFAAAVQLTDVRAGLVRGVRTVALTLLAWLLPLMVLIAGGFLLTLPFTGLEPLWKTRSATAMLLTAAAFLTLLTNAAYQDGTEATAVVLKWAARLAGLLLVPIVALAAYGLSLRIGQYGLSTDRIIAAACVLVAAGYAIGYAVAAVRPGPWMKTLEATNIAMAFGVIVVLLALVTPLADPRRLSVGDQVARLEGGKVKAKDFDFRFLRFDAGRYGVDAFGRLKTSKDPEIREGARIAALLKGRYDRSDSKPSSELKPMSQIQVFPKGQALPADFVEQFGAPDAYRPFCGASDKPCRANVKDLDEDGVAEVLIEAGDGIAVYKRMDGLWKRYGFFRLTGCYPDDVDPETDMTRFITGALETTTPDMPDIKHAGQRLRITPEQPRCETAERPIKQRSAPFTPLAY